MRDFAAAWFGSKRSLDRQVTTSVSANHCVRRCSVKPISAELKRSSSAIPKAVSVVSPGMSDKIIKFVGVSVMHLGFYEFKVRL